MRSTLFFLISFLAARPAGACQCGNRPGPLEALAECAAVFDGTLISRTPFLSMAYGEPVVLERNAFVVHYAWRGPHLNRIVILTGFSNCDFLFDVGARYVVFARPAHSVVPGLASSICLPTDSFRRSANALAVLGPGLPFLQPEPHPPESFLLRSQRITRSSFLWGVLTFAGIFDSRFPFFDHFELRLLAAPLTLLVLLGAVCHFAIRRRIRLVLLFLLLFVLAIPLSLTLQGYAVIRFEPTLSYCILERTHGA